MAYGFKFPDVGEGITEGEIVKWRVKKGDRVKEDQVLVEVETDKAVVELPSPKTGTILELHAEEGKVVKVGDVIVTIGEEGEALAPAPKPEEKPLIKPGMGGGVVGFLEEAPEEVVEKPVAPPEKAVVEKPEVLATPKVRKLAKELGVDIAQVKGTGAEGSITEEDVRKAAEALAKPKEVAKPRVVKKYDMWGYVKRVPLKGIRRTTAKHMRESVDMAAHVTHMDEADITHLWKIREKEKLVAEKKGIRLTFLPFVVKAAIAALKEEPYFNSSLDDESQEIVLKQYYNIGIAVDIDGEGLMAPVIKGADQKSILDIAKEIQELAEKARQRKIDLADLQGSTFTITNIGSVGGTHATPIINYPECAILAMGKVRDMPRVVEDKIKARKVLPLSLTFDHRIVDGAAAARFMNVVVRHLEDPHLILIESGGAG